VGRGGGAMSAVLADRKLRVSFIAERAKWIWFGLMKGPRDSRCSICHRFARRLVVVKSPDSECWCGFCLDCCDNIQDAVEDAE
jgi:hypothetical protein